MPDRVVYMRSSGGVPPNVFRLVVDVTGDVVAERHDQYPPPVVVHTRRGTCAPALVERLVRVVTGLDHTKLRGPVPDSPNEWFEIHEGDGQRGFSIMSLLMATTPAEQATLAEIRGALDAIIAAIGGEP